MGKAMADAGADALLVLTPGYFKGMLGHSRHDGLNTDAERTYSNGNPTYYARRCRQDDARGTRGPLHCRRGRIAYPCDPVQHACVHWRYVCMQNRIVPSVFSWSNLFFMCLSNSRHGCRDGHQAFGTP